jgi:hypothetical protein
MSDLFNYLTNKTSNSNVKKNKKLLKPKRFRWGQKMGKGAKNYNRKETNIDKILTLLVSRSAIPNSIETARLRDIEGDFALASKLQQEEFAANAGKTKKIETEELTPPTAKEVEPTFLASRPITSREREERFQAYQSKYDELDDHYDHLIESMNENLNPNSVVSADAMNDFIVEKERLSGERNVLRKDLLDDIKNNPNDVWEWVGFIENSEVATANLLDKDNKASSILYDQAMRNLEDKTILTEKQIELANKNADLMKKDMDRVELEKLKEELFNKELRDVNEDLTEANQQLSNKSLRLVQEATEKEKLIEELNQTQNFLSENISQTFNRGRDNIKQYLDGKITGGTTTFKVGLGQTGLIDDWDRISNQNYTTDVKKARLNIALTKKIEEQEKFLPKKVQGFMGALPPGSIVEEIREAKETLSLSRSNSAKALSRANSASSQYSTQSEIEGFLESGIGRDSNPLTERQIKLYEFTLGNIEGSSLNMREE